MGRGKRKEGRRLSALAQVELTEDLSAVAVISREEGVGAPDKSELEPELEISVEVEAAPTAVISLSNAAAPQRLPGVLRPRYAEEEPSKEVLAYARTHARNVRQGETKGAVRLLGEHLGALRRGYPALEAMLQALAERAVKDSAADERIERSRRLAAALAQTASVPLPARADSETVEAARRMLVESLRAGDEAGAVMAAASSAAADVGIVKIAHSAGWSASLRGREALVADWLAPLYLDRFLWRAYGRDYDSMAWPLHEDLSQAFAAALKAADDNSTPPALLEHHVLPRVFDFWPEVRELVADESLERTFSAKWPLELERLRAAVGLEA